MYRLLFFLVLLLIVSLTSGQERPAVCLAEKNLMEEKKSTFSNTGVYKRTILKYRIVDGVLTRARERVAVDTYHFSGDVSETTFYENNDDVRSVLVYHYNQDFQLQKKSLFDPMGNVLQTWDYMFDKDKNLVQETHKSTSKKVIDWKSFNRMEDIDAIKSIHFDSVNKVVESNITYYSSLDTGVPVKIQYYQPDGGLDYSVVISYGQNRVQKKEFLSDEGILIHSQHYTYNPKGVLTEMKKLSPRKAVLERKIYKHDENNLLTAYTEYNAHGNMLVFYRYIYTYF
ncbi:MAG: hypothetical protein ACOC31_00545 [Bacteroidota bacterium]